MRHRTHGVVIVLLAGLLVVAFGGVAQAQPPKELVGTWKLNTAKSRFNPGPAPKSIRVSYTLVGDGLKIAVELEPPEGPTQHWEMTGTYDGKEYPVTGNPNADMSSFTLVNDRTAESTFMKDGKVTSTHTRVLSPDGKTLRITSKGTTSDGKPRYDVQVFER